MMGIGSLFHSFGVGFVRMFSGKLPPVPEYKHYGNAGEEAVQRRLEELLPGAEIRRGVCLDTGTAKGEIDFLVVYENKVFLIELKTWEGSIYQSGDKFYKDKVSGGGNVYTKELKSPFRQINGNTIAMKKQYPKIWFEKAVLFMNSDSISIQESDCPWFTDAESLAYHIRTTGRAQYVPNVRQLLNTLVCYDVMTAGGLFQREQVCVIDPESVNFTVGGHSISKRDLRELRLIHHFSYDDFLLTLRDGSQYQGRNETRRLRIRTNGKQTRVALHRADRILFG